MTACVREKVLTLSSVDTGSFCKGEEMFLLGVKEAAAIVSLLILIVVLIAKLRECTRNSSTGGQTGDGSNVTGSNVGTRSQISIQLQNINNDDSV